MVFEFATTEYLQHASNCEGCQLFAKRHILRTWKDTIGPIIATTASARIIPIDFAAKTRGRSVPKRKRIRRYQPNKRMLGVVQHFRLLQNSTVVNRPR